MTEITAESRVPPSDFARANALVKSADERAEIYKRSTQDPAGFWGEIAKGFHWQTPFTDVFNANLDCRKGPISIEWFKGGKTNMCYNGVDRHIEAGKGDKVAFFYEANEEDGAHRPITYKQLQEEICRFANVYRTHGVKEGDRVTIYMPMIPQVVSAMMAAVRIGAVLNVVFGGFSAEALVGRILDCASKIIVTADGVFRGAKMIPLKATVDTAVDLAAKEGFTVETVLVVPRVDVKHETTPMNAPRDVWADDALAAASPTCEVVWMDAEAPLFVLYTSGSTGKPKGLLHTTAGYMVYASTTHKYVFDIHDDDVYFSTADVGWITGHSFLVFGPLLNGTTSVLMEGLPNFPDAGRIWRICDKYKATQLYTAPTAIRSLMKAGDEPLTSTSRASLRVLGSVGEPINFEAWRWYYEKVGNSKASVVDTWWQTETGGLMISGLPGASDMLPSWAGLPLFGIQPAVLDSSGAEQDGAASGMLCVKHPWPGQARTIYGDHERFENTYYKPYPGFYFTGDGCERNANGEYRLTGRVDDVMNVSGHRLGTAEVENAINTHKAVAESAVVPYPHDVKGEGIYAFVSLRDGETFTADLQKEIVMLVRKVIGPIAAPDVVHDATCGLPKTRSGKIMRRILRKIAAQDVSTLGDVSTLADPSVVDKLIANDPRKK